MHHNDRVNGDEEMPVSAPSLKTERHCVHFQPGRLLPGKYSLRWNKAAFPLGIHINCGLANRPVSLAYKLVGNNSTCLKKQSIWGMLPELTMTAFAVLRAQLHKNTPCSPHHTCLRCDSGHQDKHNVVFFLNYSFKLFFLSVKVNPFSSPQYYKMKIHWSPRKEIEVFWLLLVRIPGTFNQKALGIGVAVWGADGS